MRETPRGQATFKALVTCAAFVAAAVDADANQAARPQPLMATVAATAPIYIGPKVQPTPLRTAAVGTRLEVLDDQGEWVQVRFGDPVLGPRIGWVQSNLIRIERPELQPMDLSVSPERQVDAPEPDRVRNVDADQERGSRGIERSGFLIGLSAGPGFLRCEDCDWRSGFAFEFHMGGMVGPSVGLMYDSVGTAVDLDGEIVTVATTTAAVQGFVGNRGWVKGGAGFGFITCESCLDAELGLAFMGGAGVEVLQRGRFAMDVQGRFTWNQFEGIRFYSTTAMLGFNWY